MYETCYLFGVNNMEVFAISIKCNKLPLKKLNK